VKLLKIGISGVRGIVGDTITPELVMDFAGAFGTSLSSRKVLLGRDSRISGPMLHSAAVSSLLSTGCDVVDLGICPAPILQYMVKKLGQGGAVSISAGHNDAEWNALTFINSQGTYLNEFQGEEFLDLYHLGRFRKARADKLGRMTISQDHLQRYFKGLARFLDVERIKKARFKVVIDACNGGGAGIIDSFCQTIGSELIPLNNIPDGNFPHDPEPRPRNTAEVASIVKIIGADIGFSLNSDVSRVSMVTETGETLSEEYTFPLVADYYLKNHPGTVITNQSTSRKIEDVAARHRSRVIRTRVGQSFIVQSLIYEEGVLAGDGSGSVAVKDFHPAFDGFLTMGLILESLAAEKTTASQKASQLPKYHIIKNKLYCPPHRAHSIVGRVKKFYARSQTDLTDGVRVEAKDGWIHVRTSATEPMIRIISESTSRKKAEARIEKVTQFISQHI
jgi:phosphomannomutase